MDSAEKMKLKELEPLLRQSLNNKELKVIDFKVSRLVPPGENYCSLLVKLDAKVQRGNDGGTEDLHLVAKTMNAVDKDAVAMWVDLYKKELFIYAELFPVYRDLERRAGIDEKDLIDISPKYFGHRNTLKVGEDVIDEDSLILMENIKVRGFESGNRLKGLDVNYAKIALKSLARYHALGVALKHSDPDFFKRAVSHAKIVGLNLTFMDSALQSSLKIFEETSEFKKHLAAIRTSFSNALGGKTFSSSPEEPWATITHGDSWVNNILFHKNDEGQVDDVKFVDFQLYVYNSPLKDISYFFCGSLDDNTVSNHFDELLNVHYESYINTLKRMGCSTEPYSRQSFDAELKKHAIREFPMIALACRFIVYEVEMDRKETLDHDVTNVLESQCSNTCKQRLIRLVDLYEKRGWFE